MPVKLTSGKPYIKYLTHSDEDISFGMVCTCAGCCKIPPHAGYPQNPSMHPTAYRSVANGRTLNEFQIIYITEGEGTFNTGGGGQKAYNVPRRGAFLVMPGVEHHNKP
ncbi:MAG: AraC family ligand binding domain-containing protein, partial [Spirochaetaceae bacterium]|nr:AraC family ligand binding domain-containing protein [Spirochaetaceae bacterium]